MNIEIECVYYDDGTTSPTNFIITYYDEFGNEHIESHESHLLKKNLTNNRLNDDVLCEAILPIIRNGKRLSLNIEKQWKIALDLIKFCTLSKHNMLFLLENNKSENEKNEQNNRPFGYKKTYFQKKRKKRTQNRKVC